MTSMALPTEAISRERSRAASSVQMNTRLDKSLKETGDAVLRRLGYSPSQAVRTLWEFLAAHQSEPSAVREFMEPYVQEGSADAAERRKAATREIRSRYQQLVQLAGIDPDAMGNAEPTYEDLRAEWYEGRYVGGLS